MSTDNVVNEQPDAEHTHDAAKIAGERHHTKTIPVVAWVSLCSSVALAVVAGFTFADANDRIGSLQSKLDTYVAKTGSLETDLRSANNLGHDTQGRVAALEEQSIAVGDVYDQVIDSIVTVYCADALGTGFGWNVTPGAGYDSVVITNNHVIADCRSSEDARHIRLVKNDGTSADAYVWAWDEKNDLAMLMVHGKLPALAEAPLAKKGDPVIAVGSPQGLAGSVTRGIISNVYSDAYQTDAAINHGNSGGPLINKDGQVLGVTTLSLDREGLNIAVRTGQLCIAILKC